MKIILLERDLLTRANSIPDLPRASAAVTNLLMLTAGLKTTSTQSMTGLMEGVGTLEQTGITKVGAFYLRINKLGVSSRNHPQPDLNA